MSHKLKVLSGKQLVRIFGEFGFEIHSQKGSHVKLRRINQNGEKETLVIPLHDELDPGTVNAILRQTMRFIDKEELIHHFYVG